MTPRIPTLPPTEPAMLRKLLARTHPGVTKDDEEVASVTTRAREEHERIEAAFAESRIAYELARRRQLALDWADHHGRLAITFDGIRARHEAEQDRYRQILTDMHSTEGGEGIET